MPERLTRADIQRTADLLGIKSTGRLHPDAREACHLIEFVIGRLVECGYLKQEDVRRYPFSHLVVYRPLLIDLEIQGDTSEQEEARADYLEALRLFRVAADAYEPLKPLERANEQFVRVVGEEALRGEVGISGGLRAAFAYRDTLAMLARKDNAIAQGVLLELDQLIAQVRDRVSDILVERVVRCEITVEKGAEAVEELTPIGFV